MRTYGCLYPDVPVPPQSAPLIDGGSWTVTSDTWPDVDYTVTRSPDGRWECNCPAGRYHGHCKHITRVQGWLAEDPLAAAAAAVLSLSRGLARGEQMSPLDQIERAGDIRLLIDHGWDMSAPADVCWLDDAEPGYRKTAAGREIILCVADALVLERGADGGDYTGALTPADSRAGEWPWMLAAAAS